MPSFQFLRSSPGSLTPRESRSDLLAVKLLGDLGRARAENDLGSRLSRIIPEAANMIGGAIVGSAQAREAREAREAEQARQDELMEMRRQQAARDELGFEFEHGITDQGGVNLGPSPDPAQDFRPTEEGLFEGSGGGQVGQFRSPRLEAALDPFGTEDAGGFGSLTETPDLQAPEIGRADVIVPEHPAGSRDVQVIDGQEVDFGPIRVLPDGRVRRPSQSREGRARAARIRDRQIAAEQGLKVAEAEADINLDLFKDKQRFMQSLKEQAGFDEDGITPNQQALRLENQAEQAFEQAQTMVDMVERNMEALRAGEAGFFETDVRDMTNEEQLRHALNMGSIPVILENNGYLKEGGDPVEAYKSFLKDMRQRRQEINQEVGTLARGGRVNQNTQGAIPVEGQQRMAESMIDEGLTPGEALDRMRALQEKHPDRVRQADIDAILRLMMQ